MRCGLSGAEKSRAGVTEASDHFTHTFLMAKRELPRKMKKYF